MSVRAGLVAFSLLLTACSSQGPTDQDVSSASRSDRQAIEETVTAFLHAFAGRSGSSGLDETVTGPRLEDWARSISLYEPFGERLRSGRVDLGSVVVDRLEDDAAFVRVDATVTATLHHPGGKVVRAPRRFVGPMLLVRDAGARFGWSVADLVRDGRPMSLSITVFDERAQAADEGIGIEVVSLYRFSTGTFATFRITNDTDGPLVVDRPHSLIQAAGRFVGATRASDGFAMPIRPGASVEGALDFHRIPLRWLPEKVMLHFEGPRVVTVDLPAEAFLAE